MENQTKLTNILNKCISLLSSGLFIWIMILLLFFTSLEYWFKKPFSQYNICLLLIGIIIVGIVYYFISRNKGLFSKVINWIEKHPFLICFAILIVQVYVFVNIFFETSWDAGNILTLSKNLVAHNGYVNPEYMSLYPNNMFMYFYEVAILVIVGFFGITNPIYTTLVFVCINCVISNITCVLIYAVLKKYANKYYAFIGYIISIIMIAFSPWNVIPYTDALGIIFPVAIVFVYLYVENLYFKTGLITIIGYIGFQVKPQIGIMIIALVIIGLINTCSIDKKKIKTFITCLGLVAVLIAPMKLGLDVCYKYMGYNPDPNKEIGLTHFFMMGLNKETIGVYSSTDVRMTMSLPNQEAKVNYHIEESKRRLTDFGVKGYFEHLSKKNLLNYNDGTFAWGIEGGFYRVTYNGLHKSVADKLKSVFYNDGKYHNLYGSFMQMIWIMILVFVLGAMIISFVKNDKMTMILILSLLGLTLFELLFEARARYLYTYLPIYIILAMNGFQNISGLIKQKFSK